MEKLDEFRETSAGNAVVDDIFQVGVSENYQQADHEEVRFVMAAVAGR